MSVIQDGSTVKVHYKGTLNDGTEFDNSHNREEPMSVTVGSGQLIQGFDEALLGMKQGDTKTVKIECENAYGPVNEQAIQNVPTSAFPEGFEFIQGNLVQGTSQEGQQVLAIIKEVNDDAVLLDMNHPLAGKDLNFEIEVVEIVSE